MSDWRKLLGLEDVGKPTLDEINQAHRAAVGQGKLGAYKAAHQARLECGYAHKAPSASIEDLLREVHQRWPKARLLICEPTDDIESALLVVTLGGDPGARLQIALRTLLEEHYDD